MTLYLVQTVVEVLQTQQLQLELLEHHEGPPEIKVFEFCCLLLLHTVTWGVDYK